MNKKKVQKPAGLRAGAAMVEITPAAGTQLGGSGAGQHRPAEVVLEPLYARALVLETQGKKICILSLDLIIVTQEWTDLIRDAAARRFGFERHAVMVHVVQNHSAPSLGHFMFDPDFPRLPGEVEYLRGGETSYYRFAAERAIEAIGRADAARRPVQIGCGSAIRDGLAFNRRGVMRDGKICMPWFYSSRQYPLGPTHIRYLEGPTDPEVGVVCLRDDDLKMVAMLLHFTCHPVNVFATQYYAVSGDWPGAWCAAMQARFGRECVPLVINGCCGNINPWPPFEPDFTPDHRRMGGALAETADKIIGQMRFAPAGRLDWKLRHLAIPYKPADPARLTFARKMLAKHPAPLWSAKDPGLIDADWFRAASIMSAELCRKRWPKFPYEIQTMRIGDVGLVGLPGEPFVEGQLAIKIGSPAYPTFVAHACSHYVGYIPVAHAKARGGHEVEYSYWAKLAPRALDMIAKAAVGDLKVFFR